MTSNIGHTLAVAFSNLLIYLTNSLTGKLIHKIDCSAHSTTQTCLIGWGINIIAETTAKMTLEKLMDEASVDNPSGGLAQPDVFKDFLDLPRNLAFLDVERALPQLSSLDLGGNQWVVL